MKVLVFDRCSTGDFSENTGAEMIPDSAIIKDGKPFFIPASAPGWRYFCGVAVRVCRLGKNVSEKFAPRYIDAYAPCVTTVPDGISGFNALNRCHEGGVIIGEWQSPEECGDRFDFLTSAGDSVSVGIDQAMAASMVSLIGHRGVLKIGDIIVMNEDFLAADLPVDTRISAVAGTDGVDLLGFSVK